MCRGHDPFFSGHPVLLSLPIYHHCAVLMPPFSNFRKIFHFQPCFGQNFSSQDANFPNFRSLDPAFFKENPLPRPYFWKPVWHTPTQKKKKRSPPPPPRNGTPGVACPSTVPILRVFFFFFFFFFFSPDSIVALLVENV